MNPDRAQRVYHVFEAALNSHPARRANLLDEMCGGDRELRAEVDRLLAQDAEAERDRFLATLAPTDRGALDRDRSKKTKPDFYAAQTLEATRAGTLVPAKSQTPVLGEHPDYSIKQELGRGGMGVVYLAHNKLMGRDEVLKIVGQQILERPGVLERFLREIRAVAKLRHPNIVTAYSAVRLGESLAFAMEHVEGLDLARIVQSKGPLPVAHACSFIYQAALGLQHAHERGLVHRDIKPGNLMLSHEGDKATVKILDFGLAKATREEKADGGLTTAGEALGTPDFIAPEQILDATSADVRADIYSLGATLYYLLTGRPPFKANSIYELFQAHISRHADPLNLVRPEVPSELASVVAKMMAKHPTRRFQTPGEAAEALKPFFKKGNLQFKSLEAEFSHVGQRPERTAVTLAVSSPFQPATDTGEATDKLEERTGGSVSGTPRERPDRLPEPEDSEDETPSVARTRWEPWVWLSVAVGLSLLAVAVMWRGESPPSKPAKGFVLLKNLPRNARVWVDGREVIVPWREGGKGTLMSVAPGERLVHVESEGFYTRGRKLTVKEGLTTLLVVELERLDAALPKKRDDSLGSVTVVKPVSPPAKAAVTATSPGPPPIPTSAASANPAPLTVDASKGAVGALRVANEPPPLQKNDSVRSEYGKSETISGLWHRNDQTKELEQNQRDGPGKILVGVSSLSEYDFEFQVKVIRGERQLGAFFHSLSDGDGGCLLIDDNGFINRLSVVRNGVLVDQKTWWIEPNLMMGRWIRVKLQVRGQHVRCIVDGDEWFQYPNLPFTKGRVGLGTQDTVAHFRGMSLRTPDGEVLWEGLPELQGK